MSQAPGLVRVQLPVASTVSTRRLRFLLHAKAVLESIQQTGSHVVQMGWTRRLADCCTHDAGRYVSFFSSCCCICRILTTAISPLRYTAQASVDDVLRSINNHKSLQSGAPTALLAFGNGDGGGGPLAPMLENLRRCRAVANHSGELPKVTMGQSVDGFYDDILHKTDNGKTLPTWNGELYLELHRGTATSHGSIKKGNRKSEILLREIEYAGTLASVWHASKAGSGYEFPKDEVDPLWHGVLLNQFHDVLPGSGIGMIYEDAEKVCTLRTVTVSLRADFETLAQIYAETAAKGKKLLEHALSALLPGSVDVHDCNATGEDLVAINTTGFARREIIKVPLASARALSDAAIQVSHDGQAYVLIDNSEGAPVVSATSVDALAVSGIEPVRGESTASRHCSSWQSAYAAHSLCQSDRTTTASPCPTATLTCPCPARAGSRASKTSSSTAS